MQGPTFIDTNILVYAHDRSEKERCAIAQEVLEGLWASRAGVLSTQVLQEFYVVATRKLSPPLTRSEAREVVALYATWDLVTIDAPMILDATRLEAQARLSFWDALIIEAARRVGAQRVVTEDLQDGRRFGSVVVENPFPTV